MSLRRYTSSDEDSARWDGFAFRDGDIVVSTRSKHGTTWVQTILLMLIHGRVELPAPLAALSPWLDHLAEPREQVIARLAAQHHRRVIKTHTPLDGIPLHAGTRYIVAARHPLDAAVSLYHQGDNIDRRRLARLTAATVAARPRPLPPLAQWLRAWIEGDADPFDDLDSLPGVMWHLSDAWSRRAHGNVTLVHYDDLLDDLDRQMRRLTGILHIPVEDDRWAALAHAATFDSMRARADALAPDAAGILRDRAAFFRRGRSGAALELLDRASVERYHERASALAPSDLLTWLHRTSVLPPRRA